MSTQAARGTNTGPSLFQALLGAITIKHFPEPDPAQPNDTARQGISLRAEMCYHRAQDTKQKRDERESTPRRQGRSGRKRHRLQALWPEAGGSSPGSSQLKAGPIAEGGQDQPTAASRVPPAV